MRPRHDTHAAASSDKTKKYGNGKTAGQIAIQNGAAPTAILHGPGTRLQHEPELGPEPQHERSPRWLSQRRGSGDLAAHRRSEPELCRGRVDRSSLGGSSREPGQLALHGVPALGVVLIAAMLIAAGLSLRR